VSSLYPIPAGKNQHRASHLPVREKLEFQTTECAVTRKKVVVLGVGIHDDNPGWWYYVTDQGRVLLENFLRRFISRNISCNDSGNISCNDAWL